MQAAPSRLLRPDEPPAFEEIAGDVHGPLLFCCDHASHRVPRALNGLGLPEEELRRHIGWDIGAAEITRILAKRFNAPAVLSSYTRLAADCNRHMRDPAFAPAEIDGTHVPANADLDRDALDARRRSLHAPYHDTVERWAAAFEKAGTVPILVSVHSFTPHKRTGAPRPWQLGVSWAIDERVSSALFAYLAAQRPDIVVGDNEPYELEPDEDFTVPVHAMRRGWPHLQIEFRQDLVADAAGVRTCAGVLGDALAAIAGRADINHALAPPPVARD